VTEPLGGDGFRLRPVAPADVPYLVELAGSEAVEPFLAAVSPWTESDLLASIASGPDEFPARGHFVLEVPAGDGWSPAGGLAFSVQNRRSRIAHVLGVMVDPRARGRGFAERSVRLLVHHLIRGFGYHRVQLEVYGFNEAALRLFERAGLVREGVKRRAYWRHGAWQDGVLFGVVEEDLASREAAPGGSR
jgi:RimJ/RimL family protein N-acetyltransferase